MCPRKSESRGARMMRQKARCGFSRAEARLAIMPTCCEGPCTEQ